MKREKLIALIIFLIALLLRLSFIYSERWHIFSHYLSIDPLAYHRWAIEILRDGWLGKEIFYQDPLYPYFLALIYKLFGVKMWVVRIIQAILSSFTCLFIFMMGKKIFNLSAGAIAGLMACFYGVFVYYDELLSKESLSLFLITAFIYSLITAEKGYRRWLLSGIIGGLAMMVRGNLLFFVPFAVLWIWKFNENNRNKLIPVLIFLLGMGMVIFPVTLRNFVVGRDFVLITAQGGQNFYIGNNPEATGTYKAPSFLIGNPFYERDGFRKAISATPSEIKKPSAQSRYWFKKGLEFIKNQPEKWMRLMLKKISLFWNDYEIPDNASYYFFKHSSWILKICFLSFGMICPLGLTGIFLLNWEKRVLLIKMFVIVYFISVIIFFVVGRYRLQVAPFIMVLAVGMLIEILKILKMRQWLKSGMVIMGAIIIGVILFQQPAGFSRERDINKGYQVSGFLLEGEADKDFYLANYKKDIEMVKILLKGETVPPNEVPLKIKKMAEKLQSDQRFFKSPDSFKTVGLAMELAMNYQQAINYYFQATVRSNDVGEILHSISRCYIKIGDNALKGRKFEEALQWYKKSMEMELDEAGPVIRASIANLLMGNKNEYERMINEIFHSGIENELISFLQEEISNAGENK